MKYFDLERLRKDSLPTGINLTNEDLSIIFDMDITDSAKYLVNRWDQLKDNGHYEFAIYKEGLPTSYDSDELVCLNDNYTDYIFKHVANRPLSSRGVFFVAKDKAFLSRLGDVLLARDDNVDELFCDLTEHGGLKLYDKDRGSKVVMHQNVIVEQNWTFEMSAMRQRGENLRLQSHNIRIHQKLDNRRRLLDGICEGALFTNLNGNSFYVHRYIWQDYDHVLIQTNKNGMIIRFQADGRIDDPLYETEKQSAWSIREIKLPADVDERLYDITTFDTVTRPLHLPNPETALRQLNKPVSVFEKIPDDVIQSIKDNVQPVITSERITIAEEAILNKLKPESEALSQFLTTTSK